MGPKKQIKKVIFPNGIMLEGKAF